MAGTRYVTPATLAERTASWLAAVAPWSRSRPLPPLDRSALLVLDLQRYFADPASHAHLPALEAVLPNVTRLVAAFAAAGRPVVATRHGTPTTAAPSPSPSMMQRWWRDDLRQGEARAELVEAIAAGPVDRVLDKARYSAFAGTDLHDWLRSRGCETVVVCGVMTHLCCETTAREAFMLDLAPVVVADACASLDEELHVGALRGLAHGFAVVAGAGDLLAGLCRTEGTAAVEGPELPRRAELAVVGAGPAGLAAAIQATRVGLDVVVLDPDGPGGQARAAEHIENYPGFPGGIDGATLMDRFVAQARQLGLVVHRVAVEGVDRERSELRLRLAGGATLSARSVILATGAAPLPLDLPLPAGAPVVYRADALASARGKRVLVVGGGEAALDQALLVRRRGAREVRVAIRGRAPRAMERLQRRARERGIELLLATALRSLRAEGEGVELELEHAGDTSRLQVDAVVVCIGKRPRLPQLPPGLARADGTPVVDTLGRTTAEGLYIAGDARRGRYRQVAIAVGDGLAAAMHAIEYVRTGHWKEP